MGLLRFILWLLVAGGIVYLAWDQPLRYRFMTPQEIAQEQNGGQPLPEAGTQRPKRWQPQNTTLDRPSH